MYIYDLCVIDFFDPMLSIQDYLQLGKKYPNGDYLTEQQLKKFLIKGFMAALSVESLWEGDVTHIAMSCVPVPYCSPHLIVAFKQGANGHTFAFSESPCLNGITDVKERQVYKALTPQKLLLFFDECHSLVEEIFKRELFPEPMIDFPLGPKPHKLRARKATLQIVNDEDFEKLF